jgi:GTPase SAR1 family protein
MMFHVDEYNDQKYKTRETLLQTKWDTELNVVLLCFSVDDYKSYDNLLNKWAPEIKKICPNAVFLLVATKCGFRKDNQKIREMKLKGSSPISSKEGEVLADVLGCVAYHETSALDGTGVKECLDLAIRSYFVCYLSVKKKMKFRRSIDGLANVFKRKSNKEIKPEVKTPVQSEPEPELNKTERRKSKILTFLNEKLKF